MDDTRCSVQTSEIPNRLVELADSELQSVQEWIKQFSPTKQIILLIEICRVLDTEHVIQFLAARDDLKLPRPDFDIMIRGWNLALGLLLVPISSHGVPLLESTGQSRRMAMAMLYQLGRSVLLKESSETIRFGLAEGRVIDGRIAVSRSPRTSKDYFIDRLEGEKLCEIQAKVNGGRGTPESILDRSRLNDVEARMARLVLPWKTNQGTMIGYEAELDIDNHFLAVVAENTIDWRNEAGIHLDSVINGLRGEILGAIGLLSISARVKHIGFVDVGKRTIPDANYPMSLTIWKETPIQVQSICDFTGMEASEVSAALELFTVTPAQRDHFRAESTSFVPMFIEISPGYLLEPVSSIF